MLRLAPFTEREIRTAVNTTVRLIETAPTKVPPPVSNRLPESSKERSVAQRLGTIPAALARLPRCPGFLLRNPLTTKEWAGGPEAAFEKTGAIRAVQRPGPRLASHLLRSRTFGTATSRWTRPTSRAGSSSVCRSLILLAGGSRNANWFVLSARRPDWGSGFWHGPSRFVANVSVARIASPRGRQTSGSPHFPVRPFSDRCLG